MVNRRACPTRRNGITRRCWCSQEDFFGLNFSFRKSRGRPALTRLGAVAWAQAHQKRMRKKRRNEATAVAVVARNVPDDVTCVTIRTDSTMILTALRENNSLPNHWGCWTGTRPGINRAKEMKHMAVPKIESTDPSTAHRFKFSNYFHNSISVHIVCSNYLATISVIFMLAFNFSFSSSTKKT
jgi:hypothetical protein